MVELFHTFTREHTHICKVSRSSGANYSASERRLYAPPPKIKAPVASDPFRCRNCGLKAARLLDPGSINHASVSAFGKPQITPDLSPPPTPPPLHRLV